MKKISLLTLATTLSSVVFMAVGCGDHKPSYSILPTGQTFHQSSEPLMSKIDVLWVVDNSYSMLNSQQNLVDNFESFITGFVELDYDFQVAVTTTDAYRAKPAYGGGNWRYQLSEFRDGPWITSTASKIGWADYSGEPIITPDTQNIVGTFLTNAMQLVYGHGDERFFESIKTTLSLTPNNEGFLRDEAFLAIIVLTDEDDFSHDGTNWLGDNYDAPGLHSVQSYIDYLDDFTETTGASRRYNVSSISINDQACLAQLLENAQKLALRLHEMVEQTGGVKGDLCGDFSVVLDSISDKIFQLSTQFFLDREPIVSTIQVQINGSPVPPAEGSENGGWSYNSEANSIIFSGDYLPPQGSAITVNFDPVGLDF